MDNRRREEMTHPYPPKKSSTRSTEKKETEMGLMTGEGSHPKVGWLDSIVNKENSRERKYSSTEIADVMEELGRVRRTDGPGFPPTSSPAPNVHTPPGNGPSRGQRRLCPTHIG